MARCRVAELSAEEQAAFEALVQNTTAAEQAQESSWRRQVRIFSVVAVVGLAGCVLTFTFSLLGALGSLVLAFVGGYGALSTRLKYRKVAVLGDEASQVGKWRLFDRGLLQRVDIPESPRGSYGSPMAVGSVMRASAQWDQGIAALSVFVSEFNNALVPANFTIDDFALGKWVTLMRVARKLHSLSDEQISKLDELGMEWRFPRRV